MPPSPNNFHVSGSVLAPNPDVSATLKPTTPQGFNPKILFLDLIFDQQAGYWPQVVTWVSARYDKVTDGNPYESVQIFHNGEPVGGANVEVVS
ncbi:MAG TPA: hypothetical protein EYH20_02190 [Leucothrix sp.]|nr:hypothetical protein [Leucothrix sp.]